MKRTIFASIFIASTSMAVADQCKRLPEHEAMRAMYLIQEGGTIIDYCKPCGTKPGAPEVVRSLEKASSLSGKATFVTIKVNGNEKDLASTYVKIAPKTYVNIAKVIACSALKPETPAQTSGKMNGLEIPTHISEGDQ
jgi:hypothetical protein